MMRYLVLIVLLPLVFLLQGQDNSDDPQNAELLLGHWECTSIIRSGRGIPKKEYISISNRFMIVIKAENILQYFSADTLYYTAKYTIKNIGEKKLFTSTKPAEQIEGLFIVDDGLLTVTPDKLIINGGYNDRGKNFTFTRIEQFDNKGKKKFRLFFWKKK